MPFDRTRTAVTRQLKGMGATLYEVGIRHPVRGMLNREWSTEEIIHALDWLKRENFKGCDIYVRPARSTPSRLILIDDLSLGVLSQLQRGPYPAAVTVQTSPGNYQAWVKLHDDTQADVRREIARYLAREYGGDPNSADSAHYGRLAGFTNRKPQHVDATGRSPFVLLDSYNGLPSSGSTELVLHAQARIAEEMERARSMAAHVQLASRSMPQVSADTADLSLWYRDLWNTLQKQFGNDFDASRADWMAAVAMFNKGFDFQAVANAIKQHSPGIEGRKGAAVADYVIRTAGKAEIWRDLKARGAEYGQVADALLSLAQERADGRS